ncbi:MAG: thiamine pyrophosphate-dependent enzyme [Halobacteriota archaeon]
MSSDAPIDRADQFACTRAILEVTPEAAIVSNLGVASYVLAGVEDRDRNFYLWGSMGVTTPVGLGVAIAADEQVTVLDGDGSTLMSLGAFATVADADPPNLTVVVFDNGQYATTGGQRSMSELVDVAGVADSIGLHAVAVSSVDRFRSAYEAAVERDAPSIVVCHVDPVDPDARPPLDFAQIKRRFRDALGGE